MAPQLSIDDIKTQGRNAVQTWTVMADENYRRRWFVFFFPIAGVHDKEGSSNSRPGTTSSATKRLTMKSERSLMIKAAEKELEMANWQTLYTVTNNMLGSSLAGVKARASVDKMKVLKPMINEMFKPSSILKVEAYVGTLTANETDEFTFLLRSLSIAWEKARTNFNTDYMISYVPKKIKPESVFINDPFASSLTAPVSWAPPKPPLRARSSIPASRQPSPQMLKPIAAPKAVEGLLAWAGGAEQPNSTYRTQFTKMRQKYPDVIADKVLMSFACGRSVPDSLVDDKYRNSQVYLPVELESMHHLRQKKPTCQPSWHLLYKDGVVFTDKPGPHNPGELSTYKKNFTNETTVVKAAEPTLDPFASSITIAMSDHPYMSTTYQETLGRSAAMEYDRKLV